MARTFNGSSGSITTAAGGVSFAGTTIVCVVNPATNSSTMYAATLYGASTGTAIRFASTGAVSIAVSNTNRQTSPSISYAPSEGWILVAVSKAAGTTTARVHKYVYGSNTWTRADTSSAFADQAEAVASVRLGHLNSSSYFSGDVAAVAVFPAALPDNAIDLLPSGLAAWKALSPSAMWVLDQESTSTPLLDWTGGGANQTAISGTSVATASAPIGYGHPVLGPTRSSGFEHLFRNQTPALTNQSDGTPGIVTATTFRTAVDGQVPAARFFATTTVSGTYTVGLWTVDSNDPGGGTLLSSQTMGSAPTPGTWNTVAFSSPVNVTAGTAYRVGVFSGDGRYVATSSFFTTDLVNGNLTADQTGDTVGGRVITQGSYRQDGTFDYPNGNGGGTSYLVDVDFLAGGGGGGETATGAPTLPAVTASGTATATAAGTAALTLPATTAGGTGTATTTGSASITLPVLAVSAAGGTSVDGTAALVLPAVTAAGAGAATATGSAALALPVLAAAGAGTATASGSAAAALPAVTATGTGTATGSPGTSSIVDTFDDGTLAPVWSASYGGVTESGGRAQIPCTTGFASLQTGNLYALDTISMRVWPPAASGATECYVDLVLYSAGQPGGTDVQIHVDAVAGTVEAKSRVGYFDGSPVSATYHPVDHAWLRIRISGGSTLFETAPDGATWTVLRTIVTPAWLAAATDLSVNVESHRDAGTADTAEVDNVNTVPAETGTAALTLPAVAAAASGTVTAAGVAAVVLPAAVVAGSGTVSATGTATVTLAALTCAGAGAATASAAADLTLPAVGAAGTAAAGVTGAAAVTLPGVQVASVGAAAAAGLAAISLPALVAAATGSSPIIGAAALLLPAMSADGTDAPVYVRRPGRFTTGSRRSRLAPGGHR